MSLVAHVTLTPPESTYGKPVRLDITLDLNTIKIA